MARAEATTVAKQVRINEVCADCVLPQYLSGERPQWADPEGDTLRISAGIDNFDEFEVSGYPTDEDVEAAFNACAGPVKDIDRATVRSCGAIAILKQGKRVRKTE